MPFTTPLRAELIDHLAASGRGIWRLIDPLVFEDEYGMSWTVPAGFESDFASVPRAPIAFWLDGGTAHAPAALHDWAIRSASTSRVYADDLFRQAMESLNIPPGRVRRMYNAVRAHTENLARRQNPWSDS